MGKRRRRCAGKVRTADGERDCELPAQDNSIYCHQHPTSTTGTAAGKPSMADDSSVAPPSLNPPPDTSGDTAPATGCVSEINSLLEDTDLWEAVLDVLAEKIDPAQSVKQMAYKDLYVTEALRCSVVPSEACPQALVVFKGGTSLMKTHKILNRFSEDIDVNIIPPQEGTFGSGRRKRVRRELQARLNAGIPLPMEHRRFGDRFASTTITYPPLADNTMPVAGGPTYGDVLVEMNIRDQPTETTNTATVTSLVGEAAAAMDPVLLEEYPILEPFEVLAADPIIAVVDKLDALHWRSLSDNPEDTGSRARDIYDLACLLRHEPTRAKLSSDRVAEMHETVVASLPTGLAGRTNVRPDAGFAASPAFQPGEAGYEALKANYPTIRQYVYTEDDWVTFDDALTIIHNSSHLI